MVISFNDYYAYKFHQTYDTQTKWKKKVKKNSGNEKTKTKK